ncbi:outer membrane lipoprotein-sorting protein [Carboxylicivirga linearis]|uniref:Outer membrane lipoprotein-sorting protein n=1 Tax=Carboxylicivirga linearis TaxID=1628157 RepID=A0ABS5JS11_9BACT|nr:outer membrane lipoprotein-sorting protein [Carboxylicivirga linearis]MBS2097686.1 outer membrane lipoprotein-sorting protein [Carboxylicivirga linearis]
MTTIKHLKPMLLAIIILISTSMQAQDAKEIVKKADDKMQGEESSISTMSMTIKRPTYERNLAFKNWTKGTQYAMTLVTAPAQEKGQTFLKRDREMWNWNPRISRMIKLPPSMMSQGWMGSDYTNDDALKKSSIVEDYNHTLIGEEKIDEQDCYHIQLIPTEEAAVVWGKVMMWITKDEYLQMKVEYYDEDEFLVKTELAHNITTIGGRILPSQFEIIPADKPNQRTIINIENIEFNVPINDNFFSQQSMKRIR